MIFDIVKDILTVIGGITVVLVFLDLIFKIVPQVRHLGTDLKMNIAKKWKYKRLEKQAIASDIENAVNEVVFKLQRELPLGWISKASIKWIEKERLDDLVEDEIILRMRPLESQDKNLLNGIYLFFKKALFPRTKEVIPVNARQAAILQLSRRVIEENKPFLIKKFEDEFLEPAIKEEAGVTDYLQDYEEIDQKGFFASAFLRESHEIATRARFKKLRSKMGEELKSILGHTKCFLRELKSTNIADEHWCRKGAATSYAFLLIAKPFHRGVERYIKRAKEQFEKGVERLYIMGSEEQKPFARKVISAIARIPEYRLMEIFDLCKDYRGQKGGVGALFVTNILDKKAEENIESFFKEHKEV